MELEDLIKIVKIRYDNQDGQVFFIIEHKSMMLLFYRKDFLKLMKSSDIKTKLVNEADQKALEYYIFVIANKYDFHNTEIGLWLNKIGSTFGSVNLPNISEYGRFNLTAYGTNLSKLNYWG